MPVLTTHFEELLSRIEPPDHRVEAAQEVHERVRAYLKECKELPTSEPYSALTGSYRRHTAVGDIKDVDIIVKIDVELDNDPSQVIKDLKKTLDGLPAALGLEGYTEIKESRRSVHVYFKDKDFHLDVVPAIVPKEIDQKLFVPDKSWGKWIESNPIGYARYLSELNEKYNGKLVPLIKLMKHFRDTQMQIMKPKSYWLESMVVYQVVNNKVDMNQSLAEIFRDLMSTIYKKFAPILGRNDGATPSIPDPMLGNDIAWNWERSCFETFMRRVEEAEEFASRALESDDRDDAIAYWQKVFGEKHFPTDIKQALSGIAGVAPGIAVVTSQGLITTKKPSSGAFVLSQPTKFYGSE